jgi:hypothetical protein
MTWALFFIGVALVAFGMIIGTILGAILYHAADPDELHVPGIRIEEGDNIRLIRPKSRRARVIRPQAW